MNSVQWMIKLLSGPHAGAEMHLENRTYRVGQSEACDIVLHDKLLPDEAFSLVVNGDSIQLDCQGDSLALSLNGQPVQEAPLNVEAYQVYSLGLLEFCFGPSNEVWPVIVTAEQSRKEASSPSRLEASFENAETDMAATRNGRRAALTGSSKVLLNLSIFLFFVMCGVVFNSRQLDAGVVSPEPSLELAGIVTGEWNFTELAVNQKALRDGAETWLISGYVRTSADEANLKQRPQALSIVYELDIRVMEQVRRSTETLLKQFELAHLVVDIGDQPGALIISGVEQNTDKWLRLKPILLADIPGLTMIQDRVEKPENRLSLLKQWILEEGMDKEILVNAQDGRLSIISDIQLEASEGWHRIRKKFRDYFGSSLDLAVMSGTRPSIHIRSVSLGAVPYLVLADGRRYGLGANVRDGYFLNQISKEAVVLKRGEELIKYRVGSGAK
ncbi:type III secretion system inner membrane ring subunit SctD [Hahella ganghwensis]|uniref:type III secretion system inner membrane ring subunit SctD n=1 Tax=Hahella ganghwensis TaxID=286420 RepID=UPI00036BF15B|nr:type III secretion system inner membrane ring subunit SctD [Hahella ganghwensis]